jgi:hypothetical protein
MVTDTPTRAAEMAGLITAGGTYGPEDSKKITEFAERYSITETAASRILRDRGDITPTES